MFAKIIAFLKSLFAKPEVIAPPSVKKPEQVDIKPTPDKLPSETPWMDIAKSHLGVDEVNEENIVISFLKMTTLPKSYWKGETPWCSAFVTACLEQAGFKSTKDAWARSYLEYGIKVNVPRYGDIVIFSRGASSGHVGFYAGKGKILAMSILGGNQNNEVCYEDYSTMRLLGYRRPVKK